MRRIFSAAPRWERQTDRSAGKEARASHATAIAVILPACVLSGAVYFFCGLVPLHILLPVAIGVAAGGYFGAKLLPRVSGRTVSLLFAFLMIAAGVKLIV